MVVTLMRRNRERDIFQGAQQRLPQVEIRYPLSKFLREISARFHASSKRGVSPQNAVLPPETFAVLDGILPIPFRAPHPYL
jgi:hypothetical protein